MRLTAEKISRVYLRNHHGSNIFQAVEETDFVLQGGDLTVVTGRSGSGKTTFINMLAGLLRPSTGRVQLELEEGKAVDIYKQSDQDLAVLRNRFIGVVPQGQTGLQALTVLENVLAPARMYPAAYANQIRRAGKKTAGDYDGVAAGSLPMIRERAIQLLERMAIGDLTDVYSNELSGGELRRMAIARALINEPSLIIADEPTGDLDDETTEKVLDLLREKADQGAAVLLVSHEAGTLAYADRVFRMDCGRLSEALDRHDD